MIKKLIYVAIAVVFSHNLLYAQEIVPASIFGNSMVVQQGIKAPVWGTAKPNQDIKIAFAGTVTNTKADATGNWIVRLPKFKAGGPFKMTLSSTTSSVTFDEVLIGEVWLASGQSNMQFTLPNANYAAKEIAAAKYPAIRFFNVERNINNKPLQNVNGSWEVCNPTNAKKFSAVAYFFARELHLDKNVPVGIISSSWGATPAEAFISGESLSTYPDFKDSVERYKSLQKDWSILYKNYLTRLAETPENVKNKPQMIKQKNYPTAVYNAMIAPIVPYGLKGVIWYQGESNANSEGGVQYRTLFPLLINDWRTKWQEKELPFIFVQLANFKAKNTEPVLVDDWALLREAQSMALKLPNTGMAVTIDIGDANTIHPTNKQDVGKRLYLSANHVAYHQPGVYSGPQYDDFTIKNDKIELSFKETGKGLMSKGKRLTGFAVAGADKKFYWATAEILGNNVVLSSPQVPKPVAVRYAWSINPECNLYNKEGLPASPFRTDDW